MAGQTDNQVIEQAVREKELIEEFERAALEAADDFWNSDGRYGAEEIERIHQKRKELQEQEEQRQIEEQKKKTPAWRGTGFTRNIYDSENYTVDDDNKGQGQFEEDHDVHTLRYRRARGYNFALETFNKDEQNETFYKDHDATTMKVRREPVREENVVVVEKEDSGNWFTNLFATQEEEGDEEKGELKVEKEQYQPGVPVFRQTGFYRELPVGQAQAGGTFSYERDTRPRHDILPKPKTVFESKNRIVASEVFEGRRSITQAEYVDRGVKFQRPKVVHGQYETKLFEKDLSEPVAESDDLKAEIQESATSFGATALSFFDDTFGTSLAANDTESLTADEKFESEKEKRLAQKAKEAERERKRQEKELERSRKFAAEVYQGPILDHSGQFVVKRDKKSNNLANLDKTETDLARDGRQWLSFRQFPNEKFSNIWLDSG